MEGSLPIGGSFWGGVSPGDGIIIPREKKVMMVNELFGLENVQD
jgi:hypothetical protein